MELQIGEKYNWAGQAERLIYLGNNWSGNGYWHQFAKVESPDSVWCEVLDSDLRGIEETHSSTFQRVAKETLPDSYRLEGYNPETDEYEEIGNGCR